MDAHVNSNEEVQMKNLKPAQGSDREKSPISETNETKELVKPIEEVQMKNLKNLKPVPGSDRKKKSHQ